MSNVVLMLGNDDVLPQPKQPGFFTERDVIGANCSSSLSKPCSVNECSVSELEPRQIAFNVVGVDILFLYCYAVYSYILDIVPGDKRIYLRTALCKVINVGINFEVFVFYFF